MRAEDELDVADLPDLSKAEREKIAREHAEKMSAQRKAEQKKRREARAALAALGDEDASVYERAAEGIATGRPMTETEVAANAVAGDGSGTTGASGDGESAKDRKMKRKHPGTPANASLINAFEARAKLPQPRLNLSRRKNSPKKPEESEEDDK